MCTPAIAGKPSATQLAGLGKGGTGVTIASYTPTVTPVLSSTAQTFSNQVKGGQTSTVGLFPTQGGTFTLSNGTTQNAAQLIAQNQQNAYGQAIPTAVTAAPSVLNSLVGQELTAAPAPAPAAVASPAPASAPARTTAAPASQSAPAAVQKKATPKEQSFSDTGRGSRGRGRASSTLRAAAAKGGGSTLITGGKGVKGSPTTSGKTLFGQ